MLKPFRINNFPGPVPDEDIKSIAHDDHNNHADGAKFLSLRPDVYRAGILHISSDEYDQAINTTPQAKLHYIDEDDGEEVTVGSSLELSQRLEEPATQPLPSTLRHLKIDGENVSSTHIFDIRRTNSVTDLWGGFLEKTAVRLDNTHNIGSRTSNSENNTAHFSPSVSRVKDSVGDEYDPRSIWFSSCRPPQVPHEGCTNINNGSSSEQASEAPLQRYQSIPSVERTCSPSGPSALTDLGRQQAQEAGSALRKAKDFGVRSGQSSPLIPIPPQNPWSSYRSIPPKLSSSTSTQRETANPELSSVETSQPLLANFETELSKMMEEHLVSKNNSNSDPQNIRSDSTSEPDESQPVPENSSPSTSRPADVLSTTMSTLLGGVGRLASDLRARLPELEQRLSNAQQQLPSQVETTLRGTIDSLGNHVQVLANAIQEAASSARAATDRHRSSELQAAERAINGLRDLAGELSEVGRTLFASFEARTVPGGQSTESQQTVINRGGQELSLQNQLGARSSNNIACDRSQRDELHNTPQEVPRNPSFNPATSDGQNEPTVQTQYDIQSPEAFQGTLSIRNLPVDATESIVIKALAQKGFIGQVQLPKDPVSGNHGGSGYIRFPTIHAAFGALQSLQNTFIGDKLIHLEFNLSNTQPEQKPPTHPSQPPSSQRETTMRPNQKTVAFSSPDLNTDAVNVRRAKSLGTLHRSKDSLGRIAPQNQGKGPNAHGTYNIPPSSSSSVQNTGSLLDQDNSNSNFSARYPSLLSGGNQQQPSFESGNGTSGQIQSSSNETGIARFPPVSQPAAPTYPMPQFHQSPRRHQTENGHMRRNHFPAPPYVTHPHWPFAGHLSRSMVEFPHNYSRSVKYPRVAPPRNGAEFNQPARQGASIATNAIDKCISDLQTLGYGGVIGRDAHRLRVYAEAANGNVADAIEIIEEERKAYQQRSIRP